MICIHYVLSMKYISKHMIMQINKIICPFIAIHFHSINQNSSKNVKLDHTYALGTSQTVKSKTGYVSARFTGGTELVWIASTCFHQTVPCNHKHNLYTPYTYKCMTSEL